MDRVISADTHVFEPPELWLDRVKGEFAERAPRIIRKGGTDYWTCDGFDLCTATAGNSAGKRFEGNFMVTREGLLDDVRPGGFIPGEAIKDMDRDGIDAGVVYPSAGLLLYSIPDSRLVNKVFEAYNDWVGEYSRAYPERLKGIALINLDDIAIGIKELQRSAKAGLSGALISSYPGEKLAYSHPRYEEFWAAAEDLGMIIGLHISTNRVTHEGQMFQIETFSAATLSNADHWVRQSLGHMIFSGVFERHPKLRVTVVEYEMSWVPHFLNRIDYTYLQRPREYVQYRYKSDKKPSDYFRENVFIAFTEDLVGVKLRSDIGIDNIMWGSDYPHPEGTFPRSMQVLDEMLADCTAAERAKITGGNCARVFGL